MALKMGTENKRQVYLAAGLFAVMIGLAIYEFTGSSSSSNKTNTVPRAVAMPQAKVAVSPALPLTPGGNQPVGQAAVKTPVRTGEPAEKLASPNIDPALHLARLSYTESILYEGRGRNIFSADSVPMEPVVQPIAPARPSPTVVSTAPVIPPRPQAPPIDLKYFGYTISKDKTYSAFFVRGDDIFTARSGEIVDHRYKVGTISAASVQLTDLNYNNTQSVPLSYASTGRE